MKINIGLLVFAVCISMAKSDLYADQVQINQIIVTPTNPLTLTHPGPEGAHGDYPALTFVGELATGNPTEYVFTPVEGMFSITYYRQGQSLLCNCGIAVNNNNVYEPTYSIGGALCGQTSVNNGVISVQLKNNCS